MPLLSQQLMADTEETGLCSVADQLFSDSPALAAITCKKQLGCTADSPRPCCVFLEYDLCRDEGQALAFQEYLPAGH